MNVTAPHWPSSTKDARAFSFSFLLVPFAFSAALAGATSALGVLASEDESDFPVLELALGLAAGSILFGVSALAD